MKQIKFEFDIGESVKITPLERTGKVKSYWVGESGIQYQVRYFDNAEARTIYFDADELQHLRIEGAAGKGMDTA